MTPASAFFYAEDGPGGRRWAAGKRLTRTPLRSYGSGSKRLWRGDSRTHQGLVTAGRGRPGELTSIQDTSRNQRCFLTRCQQFLEGILSLNESLTHFVSRIVESFEFGVDLLDRRVPVLESRSEVPQGGGDGVGGLIGVRILGWPEAAWHAASGYEL